MPADHDIDSLDRLRELYGQPAAQAWAKETPGLTPAYRRWLEQARFFALATSGPEGLDCSPRGDAKGAAFAVLSDTELAIPDRRGNNRLDSLANIVVDGRVALLFLIPGILEALRVNGRATLTTDPTLRARFAMAGREPVSVIRVTIEAVYFQCARALMRSQLWSEAARLSADQVPTAGEMTKAADPEFDAENYDAALRARQRDSLY